MHHTMMIAEMRRYPQMGYKSDVVVLSGKIKLLDGYVENGFFLRHTFTRNLYSLDIVSTSALRHWPNYRNEKPISELVF